MKKRVNRRDNRGYSLVELLVAIAILSVVVGGVIGFFMYITKSYHRGNAESDLQNEAQLTMTQIETLVVNASQGVGLDPALPATQTTGDEMFVYNRLVDDSTGTVKYQVTHIYTDDNKLKYCYMDYSYNPGSASYILSADYQNPQTLSNYVENFSVDVSDLVSNNRVGFSIDFKTRGDRQYKTNNKVLLRNKVLDKTNGSPNDYFAESITEDEKNEVTKLEVSPKDFSMWAGTSTANPFSVTYYKDDGNGGTTVTDKGSAVWTFEPARDDADINRATGAINLQSSANGDLTVRATDQSSVERNGLFADNYIYDTATIHVKSVNETASLTPPVQDPNNLSVAYGVFTIYGNNFRTEDLGTITPTVMQGSSMLNVTIIADEANSGDDHLCYTVRVQRPSNYLGKGYTLRIHAMVPGNKECKSNEVTWNFAATPGDEDKVISAVKLEVSGSDGTVSSEGGSVSVSADRGDDYTVVMYAKYKDKNGVESDYMPLSADSWGLEQASSEESSSIVAGAADYKIYVTSQDYNKDFSIDFTTTYSDGNGGVANGPSVRLSCARVKFAVKNVLGNQKVFPVTAGQTTYIYFEVQGLKNASVFVKDGNASRLSITPSGTAASVTAANNAMSVVDYTFGLKDGKGHVLNGVTCDVTVWPEQANTATYNGGKADNSIYIPSISDISSIDPSKTAPEAGKSTTIFMPDGEKITYTNITKQGVDGSNHKYWAEYNGKTYYYVQNAHQWRLNEK